MSKAEVTDMDRKLARGYLSGAFDDETPVDIIARAIADAREAERERCMEGGPS